MPLVALKSFFSEATDIKQSKRVFKLDFSIIYNELKDIQQISLAKKQHSKVLQ